MTLKRTFRFFLLISWIGTALIIQSCVTEPDSISPEIEITKSTVLTSFLNGIGTGRINPEDEDLDIHYPILFAFNSGVTIEMLSNEGLLQAARSQSGGLYITGMKFPIEMDVDDQLFQIADESDFQMALGELGARSLRDEIERTFLQCFDFVYPISLITSDEVGTIITSNLEFLDFLANEGPDYQPQFLFPVSVNDFSKNSESVLESLFDMYQIFNACEGCPELFFETEKISQFNYTFTADFPGIENLSSYEWLIDGEVVEIDGTANQGDNLLTESLGFGLHEICIRAENPECALGTEYCRTIFNDPCPNLTFSINVSNGSMVRLIATFPEKDEIPYTWTVFSGGVPVLTKNELPGGSNQFGFDLGTGMFEVCISTETEDCPEGVVRCIQLIIN
ncbi:MAG: hypothetical protein RIM99_08460 [Cyclobacteriaceae bacterium]